MRLSAIEHSAKTLRRLTSLRHALKRLMLGGTNQVWSVMLRRTAATLFESFVGWAKQTRLFSVVRGSAVFARLIRAGLRFGASQYRYAANCLLIKKILRRHASAKGVVIYPPYVTYSLLRQRPHQLGRALAEQGYLFFFCTSDGRRDAVDGFKEIGERFYLSSAPLEVFRAVDDPLIYVSCATSWRPLVNAITGASDARIFYDWMDDLAVFGPVTDQIADHMELLQRAEIVAASATVLHDEARKIRPDVLLLPNGVRIEDFDNPKDSSPLPPPPLRQAVGVQRPIVGYYGSISSWFDFDLLERVLEMNTDKCFIIIGHVWGLRGGQQLRWSKLKRAPNLIYVEHIDYNALGEYLRWFDVATIPFCLNNVTHATSPIKLFEYMAAGRPIVTTGMRECARYRSVLRGDTAEEFSNRIAQALSLRNDPQYLALLRKEARDNKWVDRAAQLDRALSSRNGKG